MLDQLLYAQRAADCPVDIEAGNEYENADTYVFQGFHYTSREEQGREQNTAYDGEGATRDECEEKYDDVFELQGVVFHHGENAQGQQVKSRGIFAGETARVAIKLVVSRVITRVGKGARHQYISSEDEAVDDVEDADDIGVSDDFAVENFG